MDKMGRASHGKDEFISDSHGKTVVEGPWGGVSLLKKWPGSNSRVICDNKPGLLGLRMF
jgi:hypothetical protein